MTLTEYLSEQRGRAAALAVSLSVPAESVSQWQSGVKRVPAERCPAIERATSGAVRCEDMRPDVDWGILRLQAQLKAPSKSEA
jgi:DNA-binding transcriptional regulator YdaS (Cro superfamily)